MKVPVFVFAGPFSARQFLETHFHFVANRVRDDVLVEFFFSRHVVIYLSSIQTDSAAMSLSLAARSLFLFCEHGAAVRIAPRGPKSYSGIIGLRASALRCAYPVGASLSFIPVPYCQIAADVYGSLHWRKNSARVTAGYLWNAQSLHPAQIRERFPGLSVRILRDWQHSTRLPVANGLGPWRDETMGPCRYRRPHRINASVDGELH